MTPLQTTDKKSPFLDIAFNIGTHLAKTAIWNENACNWTGSTIMGIDGISQLAEAALGADLYNGVAGIALFLQLLNEKRPDVIIEETLTGCMNQLMKGGAAKLNSRYGYFDGEAGIANTLILVGKRTQRPDWEAAGWSRLLQVCTLQPEKAEIDVITGVAGAIPMLIPLFHMRNDKELLNAIIKCADVLLDTAIKSPQYWSWKAISAQPALTGYSHGCAGIALALLETYTLTRDAKYLTAAVMGFNFERATYNSQVNNWPDLRVLNNSFGAVQSNENIYGESWCHGAPGIALSRLRAWQLTNDPIYKQEAEIALSTTHLNLYHSLINPENRANFSLCHGVAGNADILLEGAKVLNYPHLYNAAADVGKYGVERYHDNGINWPGGVHDPNNPNADTTTPGLMLGYAGTGYFYLRLAYPEINSVLLPQ